MHVSLWHFHRAVVGSPGRPAARLQVAGARAHDPGEVHGDGAAEFPEDNGEVPAEPGGTTPHA